MSQQLTATKIGSQLASKLKGITDEKVIKALSIEAWNDLKDKIPNPSTFSSRGLSNARKAVKEVFPDSERPLPGYYFTNQGKGQTPRYEHLALWYLTSNTDRWEIVGDKARQAYVDGLPQLSGHSEQPQPEPQPQPQTIKLENMTLQQLELDTETYAIVQDALTHSGMSLADFVRQACKVYGKTLVGKATQVNDLESISTEELLNNKKLRTLPGRAEELAKRAIQAIMSHNDNATEKSQKWFVSPAAINLLTGSKIPLIKSVFEQFKIAIDDHNIKHQLSPYDHRGTGRNIKTEVSLVNSGEVNLVNLPEATVPEPTTLETTVQDTAPVEPKPVTVSSSKQDSKVFIMPLESSTYEIFEKLSANPNHKVRIRDGRKAYTYVLVDANTMEILETGEVIKMA